MKILKQHWDKVALTVGAAIMVLTLFSTGLLWGQTATGLKIGFTAPNQVNLTVTNGFTNGIYHIFFTEFLNDPNFQWTLVANGTTGQTNFSFLMDDYDQAFFKAVSDSHFMAPSISVIIQSPANGSVVQ